MKFQHFLYKCNNIPNTMFMQKFKSMWLSYVLPGQGLPSCPLTESLASFCNSSTARTSLAWHISIKKCIKINAEDPPKINSRKEENASNEKFFNIYINMHNYKQIYKPNMHVWYIHWTPLISHRLPENHSLVQQLPEKCLGPPLHPKPPEQLQIIAT